MNGYGLTDRETIRKGLTLHRLLEDSTVTFEQDTPARMTVITKTEKLMVRNPWTNEEKLRPVNVRYAAYYILDGDHKGQYFAMVPVRI